VVDREGVGRIHGLGWHTARARKPWADDGHPSPVNRPAGPPVGRSPALWDTMQVRAHTAGRPVPAIPTEDHPDDLLDEREVAALHKLTVRQFQELRAGSRVNLIIPAPDATPYGVDHWRRATAEAMRVRVDPTAPRPTGTRADRRAVLAAQAAALARPGDPVNISELARRSGVSRATARNFLHRLDSATS
jgi:hypothetical protein